jgi:esterase/lipase superfamily enzyme
MDHVFTVRSVRSGDFSTEPGATHFLAVPDSDDDPKPTHAIHKTAWFDQVFQASRHGTQNDGARGDILFYVHGFNTENSVMLARQRLLKVALEAKGFEGVVVGFDWPAATSALNYLEDRVDAKITAFRLVTEGIANFARMQRTDCFVNLHVLAQSTGAFVVREAFDDADDRTAVAAQSWSVSQVMLMAADVSVHSLDADNSKSSSLYRHCVRLTNYYSPRDEILSVSAVKRVGVARRAGRVGLDKPPVEKAANVYCGEHFKTTYPQLPVDAQHSHAWYFDDPILYQDVFYTISGGLDRNEFPTRGVTDKGNLMLKDPAT